MTAITPSLLDAYTESSGPFRSVLGGQAVNESTLLSFLVFGMMQLLTSFNAVSLASSWVAEELDGRLELELACPTPRVKYFQKLLGVTTVHLVSVWEEAQGAPDDARIRQLKEVGLISLPILSRRLSR